MRRELLAHGGWSTDRTPTRPKGPKSMAIAFIDLQAQRKRIEPQINAAVQKVIESGAYIMGPEVKQFETELAAFSGAKHALGCARS